jgi:hypothetical protein
VIIAWIVAAFGPLIALAGLIVAGLQLKAADGQLRAAEGQLEVMRAQLSDAHQGAAQTRKDTDAVIAAAKEQAKSMQVLADANKVMADAAKVSADNSARIASSSEHSINTTQDAVRLDQRAWLGVRGATNGQFPNINGLATIDLVITNTGKTPALHVDICSDMQLVMRKDDEIETLSDDLLFSRLCPPIKDWMKDTVMYIRPDSGATAEKRRYFGVINPGQEVHIAVFAGSRLELERGLLPGEIQLVRSNEARLFITSRATYWDASTPSRKHTMNFCARWQQPPSDKLFPCPFGNDSD